MYFRASVKAGNYDLTRCHVLKKPIHMSVKYKLGIAALLVMFISGAAAQTGHYTGTTGPDKTAMKEQVWDKVRL